MAEHLVNLTDRIGKLERLVGLNADDPDGSNGEIPAVLTEKLLNRLAADHASQHWGRGWGKVFWDLYFQLQWDKATDEDISRQTHLYDEPPAPEATNLDQRTASNADSEDRDAAESLPRLTPPSWKSIQTYYDPDIWDYRRWDRAILRQKLHSLLEDLGK